MATAGPGIFRGLSANVGPNATSEFAAELTAAEKLPEHIKAAADDRAKKDALYALQGDLSDQKNLIKLGEYIDRLSRNAQNINVTDALIQLSKLPTTPGGKRVNPLYIQNLLKTMKIPRHKKGLSKISTWLVTTCTVAVSACGNTYLFNLILKIATYLSELIFTFGVKYVYDFFISILTMTVTTMGGAPCLSATIFTVVACAMSMVYHKYRVGIQTVGAQGLQTLREKVTATPSEPEQIQAVETAVETFYNKIKKINEIKRRHIVNILSGMDEKQITKLFEDLRNETTTEVFEKIKAGEYHDSIALVNKIAPDLKEFLAELKKIAVSTDNLAAQLHGYDYDSGDEVDGGSSKRRKKSSRKPRSKRRTIRRKVSKTRNIRKRTLNKKSKKRSKRLRK
jgi:hypothetical protein